MHFIFVVSNMEDAGEEKCTASQIMQYLLGEAFWAFSRNAPNLNYFSEGNKVIVYLAGEGNHCFAADFTLSCKPYKVGKQPEEPDWLLMFPIRVKLQNINIWPTRLPIRNVLTDISFVKNKTYYGLYFRQSTKSIDEKDYYNIVERARRF